MAPAPHSLVVRAAALVRASIPLMLLCEEYEIERRIVAVPAGTALPVVLAALNNPKLASGGVALDVRSHLLRRDDTTVLQRIVRSLPHAVRAWLIVSKSEATLASWL